MSIHASQTSSRVQSGTQLIDEGWDDDERPPNTPAISHGLRLYQQLLIIFDGLNSSDREDLVVLVNAYAQLPIIEKKMLVNAAEKLAGL